MNIGSRSRSIRVSTSLHPGTRGSVGPGPCEPRPPGVRQRHIWVCICFYMFFIWFYMFLYDFIWFLYDFIWLLYDFWGVTSIFGWPVFVEFWTFDQKFDVPPKFSDDPFFWILNFRPEIGGGVTGGIGWGHPFPPAPFKENSKNPYKQSLVREKRDIW